MEVMAKETSSKKVSKQKRPVLFIQLSDAEEKALNNFIRDQTVEPDRSAVGKKALLRFLESLGYWPLKNKE